MLQKLIGGEKVFLQTFCGVKGSEIELFWGGFGIIKIKYRLNNSTFRYEN